MYFGHVLKVTMEAKKKAAEAKARGDDAYRRKDYLMAVDAYTQVHIHALCLRLNMIKISVTI